MHPRHRKGFTGTLYNKYMESFVITSCNILEAPVAVSLMQAAFLLQAILQKQNHFQIFPSFLHVSAPFRASFNAYAPPTLDVMRKMW